MTVIPATIPEPERTTRRLGELLGLPTAGSRESSQRPEREARPLPLVAVKVRARIVADCAVTELEERFANASTQPMDVTHTIPLPADGAVVAFEISAGERVARGRCKRTEEARADFADAARRGKTAAFLDSVRDDVHVVNLANVPPKSEIVVRLTIVERLRVDDGRFEYRFPTTISPKFVPGDSTGHDGHGTSPDTDRAPDASRLTPPVRLDGGTLLDLEIALPDHVTDLGASMPLVRSAA